MNSQNPYPGVNAHLHSYLQQHTGWKGFHNSLANALLRHLTANLPVGYFATNEQSLQISSPGNSELTTPDASIYTTTQDTPAGQTISPSPTPMLEISVAATLPEAEYLPSVVVSAGDDIPGNPIIRFEVLSPANKPPGSHFATYVDKRTKVLSGGLRLVEIDLLHQQRPIAQVIPSYPDQHPDAKPYYILVNDPRPDVQRGRTYVYGVGVLDPLPTLTLPLLDRDVVNVDFGGIYDETFRSSGMYPLVVDYSALPPNATAYTPGDRAAIQTFLDGLATTPKDTLS
jgi:hypothetical protein